MVLRCIFDGSSKDFRGYSLFGGSDDVLTRPSGGWERRSRVRRCVEPDEQMGSKWQWASSSPVREASYCPTCAFLANPLPPERRFPNRLMSSAVAILGLS